MDVSVAEHVTAPDVFTSPLHLCLAATANVTRRKGRDAERDARPVEAVAPRGPPAEDVEEQPQRLAEDGAVALILLGRLKVPVRLDAIRLQLHVEANRADVSLTPLAHDPVDVDEAGPVQPQGLERLALHQVPPFPADAGILADAGEVIGLVPASQLDNAFRNLCGQRPFVLWHCFSGATVG